MRLRWLCKQLGFERLTLKNRKLRCYFISNPQSPFFETPLFNHLLQFIAKKGPRHRLSFKKSVRHFILIRDEVKNLKEVHRILNILIKSVEAALGNA